MSNIDHRFYGTASLFSNMEDTNAIESENPVASNLLSFLIWHDPLHNGQLSELKPTKARGPEICKISAATRHRLRGLTSTTTSKGQHLTDQYIKPPKIEKYYQNMKEMSTQERSLVQNSL